MKLACEVIKAWLVPYSEGTLRAHRPYLHGVVRRHLRVCAKCRQDEVLLHRTAMALRHYQSAPGRTLRRSRVKSPVDVPLSSRVLQAIRDERTQDAMRRSERRSYPLAAYATSVALLCVMFAIVTQPIGARPWFARYFFAHPKPTHATAPAPVTPPYPMHDPFAVPADLGGPVIVTKPDLSVNEPHTDETRARPAAWTPAPAHPFAASVAAVAKPAAAPVLNLQAQEAMTAAEAAERNRISLQVIAQHMAQPPVTLVVPPAPTAVAPASAGTPLAPAPAPQIAGAHRGQPSGSVPAEFAHPGSLQLLQTTPPAPPSSTVPGSAGAAGPAKSSSSNSAGSSAQS